MSFEPDDEPFLRPFLVTGGRTQAQVEGLQFETLVSATGQSGESLRFEAARIHALCADPVAIAELSAHLQIPLGTVRVIVGDLIVSEHIVRHDSVAADDSDTLALVSRLIDGVKKL